MSARRDGDRGPRRRRFARLDLRSLRVSGGDPEPHAPSDDARADGLLGPRVLGSDFSFDVDLVVGRGSYECGEETALLNSIEAKRPVARIRPPYVAERGLWGMPTVVNNAETLANVPWIMQHGAAQYGSLGISGSRGTKVVSLNSLFRRPGLYEVEFGTTLREIVEEIGGGLKTGTLRGLMIGGPLAGVVPPAAARHADWICRAAGDRRERRPRRSDCLR